MKMRVPNPAGVSMALSVSVAGCGRIMKHIGLFAAVVGALLVGCAGHDGAPAEHLSTKTEAVVEATQLSFEVPSGVDFYDVAFGSREQLRLHDRVWVLEEPRRNAAQYADVSNAGGGGPQNITNLSPGSRVGNLTSRADLWLSSGSSVSGSTSYSGALNVAPGAFAPVLSKDSTLTASTFSWDPKYTPSSEPAIVYGGQTRALAPGSYGMVTSYPSALVQLRTGTYFIDQLDIEQASRFSFDTSAGPIYLYVKTSLVMRGSDDGADASKILIGYLGQLPVTIDSGFDATLVAPLAPVRLGTTGKRLSGSVFAKVLEVDSDVQFTHKPFGAWSDLLPPSKIDLRETPINLQASRDNLIGTRSDGSAIGGVPTSFEIPSYLPVKSGNAGNGAATLTFTDTASVVVVCNYKGGSATAHAANDVDSAKGSRFKFVSCTNGSLAGAKVTGKDFKLQVLGGDANFPVATTIAAVHLGPGCSTIPSPIAPEEVAELRRDFTWLQTPKLPERNVAGRPALYYVGIYVENEGQLADLDRLNIMWDMMPLMKAEAAGMIGKCGVVERAADRKGMMVWGVVPGLVYNLIRQAGAYSEQHGMNAPFQIMLPYVLDEARAPGIFASDGSFEYKALAASGYLQWLTQHRAQQPNIFGDAWNFVKSGAEWAVDAFVDVASDIVSFAAQAWNGFVAWVAVAAQNAWESVQDGLGDFLGFFLGEVQVRVDIRVINRDPTFPPDTPVVRGWGANAGALAVPHGARGLLKQWGLGFVPVQHEGVIGDNGHLVVDAVQDAGARSGGLCIKMDADSGSMTSFLAPDYFCDFNGLDFHHFRGNLDLVADTNDKEIFAFTQLVDSYDYALKVIGFPPHFARVLTGTPANMITGLLRGTATPMTVCLNFPSVGEASVTLIGAVVGTALAGQIGAAVGPAVIAKDIWYPDTDGDVSKPNSRGIMTHEYGHYLMCSMLYGEGGAPALNGLLAIPFSGSDRDSDARVMAEAWADTFAAQVAGGTNYFRPPGTTPGLDVNFSYCANPVQTTATPSCVESNLKGEGDASEDPMNDEIAKWTTLFVDAFDSERGVSHGTDLPYFDLWTGQVGFAGQASRLKNAPAPYLVSFDEPVSIGGRGWQNWVRNWLTRGVGVTKAHVVGGLVDAMAQAGTTWCGACEVFAMHDPSFTGTDVPLSFTDRWERWRQCTLAGGYGFLGSAPEPDTNIDASCRACPPHQFAAPDGRCTACPPGQVAKGNQCQACPSGSVPSEGNQCTSCPDYKIAVGNSCVSCNFGESVDRATNTCVECPAALTVDWRNLPELCPEQTPYLAVPDVPSAICPQAIWVEVNHLDVLAQRGGDGLSVEVDTVVPRTSSTCRDGSSNIVSYRPNPGFNWDLLDNTSSGGTWIPEQCGPDTLGNQICAVVDHCEFERALVSTATIQAGLSRVRFYSPKVSDISHPPTYTPLPTSIRFSRKASCPGE